MSVVSEIVSNASVDATVEVLSTTAPKVRAARKPALNGKYSKLMTLAYQICQELQAQTIIADEAGFQSSLGAIQMWASIDEQSSFYERLLGESSESSKSIRRIIALHNKPVKVKAVKEVKEVKPKAVKEVKPKAVKAAKVKAVNAVIEPVDRPSTPILLETEEEFVASAPVEPVVLAATAAVAAESKPVKSKKTKKTDQVVAETSNEPVDVNAVTAAAPKPRGRKKTEVSVLLNNKENIIAQIVAAANGNDDVSEPEPSAVTVAATTGATDTATVTASTDVVVDTKTKPKRKPAVKAVVAPVVVAPVVESLVEQVVVESVVVAPVQAKKQAKARKPATKVAAEPEVVTVPVTVPAQLTVPVPAPVTAELEAEADDEDEDDEEEIQARRVTYENVEYLVDQNNKVYEPIGFDHIGTYAADGTITLF